MNVHRTRMGKGEGEGTEEAAESRCERKCGLRRKKGEGESERANIYIHTRRDHKQSS